MAKSSQMPDGGYDPQLGSNYMMDGFDFDSEYGSGVEDARKDPSLDLPRSQSGLAVLPDGFLGAGPEASFDFRMLQASDEDGGLDLSNMVREATPLMDLSWLEGAEQDPARLPVKVNEIEYTRNPLNQTVLSDVPDSGTRPELSQAWGVDRRTDGQNIVPNVVYPRPVTGPTSALPGDPRSIVAHAMRRSAFGEDIDSILREVVAFLGPDIAKVQASPEFKKLAAAIRSIRAEHGVVGNIYVRDSAFPKILSGKWDAAIKKRCASARYFLTTPGSKLSAHERYLGKEVVTSIPWSEAADHYRPIFAAQGKRLASGDPKKALIMAFRTVGAKERKATNFPTHVEARSAFTGSEAAPVVKTRNADADLRKRADARIDRWVKAGLLSGEKAREMRAQIDDPRELYRVASAEVATATSKGYSGAVFTTHQADKKASSEGLLEIRRLLRWASKQMSEGSAGRDLDYLLTARFSSEVLKQASGPLTQLRKKHEGLSGHLYVEASAYASPSGTEGCEKGALIHRANQIKSVLEMDRCASCTANVEGNCQKYNKTLVASAPVKSPEKYAAEMIRLANSDDAERTASFFTASYDPSEYELRNDNLDDIEFSNAPPVEDLGSVLFEGLTLGDEE